MQKTEMRINRTVACAALTGAATALAVALFIPPIALLAAGAVVAGVVYAYRRYRKNEASGDVIDVESKEVE